MPDNQTFFEFCSYVEVYSPVDFIIKHMDIVKEHYEKGHSAIDCGNDINFKQHQIETGKYIDNPPTIVGPTDKPEILISKDGSTLRVTADSVRRLVIRNANGFYIRHEGTLSYEV